MVFFLILLCIFLVILIFSSLQDKSFSEQDKFSLEDDLERINTSFKEHLKQEYNRFRQQQIKQQQELKKLEEELLERGKQKSGSSFGRLFDEEELERNRIRQLSESKRLQAKFDGFNRGSSEYIEDIFYKGQIGESIVNSYSKQLNGNYHIFNNIVLRAGYGTTQIDQVIFSKFGIFVLEVKNMRGWIFGNVHQLEWTQRFRTGAKFQFQNPLHQNYKHIKVLQGLLGFSDGKFKSIVVFVGEGVVLKTALPVYVTIQDGYLDYIWSHKGVVLSNAQVDYAINKIDNNRLPIAEHEQYMRRLKGV